VSPRHAKVDPLAPKPEWAPAFWTPRKSALTDGDDVALFASTFMVATKGFRAGKPLNFADWQKWALEWALERNPATGLLRYRQAILGLPRKTAKSLKGSSIALKYLVGTPELGREIYSIAGDRQQAKLVFGEARWQVLNHPLLKDECKVYRDAIEHVETGSIYRVLSHDGKLAQGLNPFLTIADEPHIYPSSQTAPGTSELWEAMLQGSGARPESLLLGITTAGDYRDDALLTRLFDYGRDVASGEVDDDSFGIAWWQAPDGCDHRDEAMWHIANPNLRLGLADIEEMRSTVKSTPENVFRRYRLNQMVRLGGIAWMDMAAWKAAARPDRAPKKGERIVMAFDGSVSSDATALMGMTLDGHLFVLGVWETDGTEEWQVPRGEVMAAVEDAFDLYDVRAFNCDTAYWLAEFQVWQDTYGRRRVLDFTMSNARMVPAVQEFYAGVGEGAISHPDDPRLNRHISNAVSHETPRGITIKKQSKDSMHKIDLAVAACMANDARLRQVPRRGFTGGF
jgi:phage terminase large subunit-like protein